MIENKKELNRALGKGNRSYNSFLGDWWYLKSRDRFHVRAYNIIALELKKTLRSERKQARRILDYACGNAGLILALAAHFPQSSIVGIDGSIRMLEIGEYDLRRAGFDAGIVPATAAFSARGPRIRLVNAALPDFSFPAHKVDAAIFSFPNMNFTAADARRLRQNIFGDRETCDIARFLSRLPDLDHPDEAPPEKDLYEDLLYERAMSRNIHGILTKGGVWLKADYSNCHRADLSELIQWRMLFSESSFDVQIREKQSRDCFQFLANRYHRSRVIRDVYEQTLNPRDSVGGYMISTFRAR